jgi:hypothetical protein
METIEKDGKTYDVYRWRTVEDCKDIPIGEVVVAIYQGSYFSYPIIACYNGNGHFTSMHGEIIPAQPLYVMQLPPVGGVAVVDNQVEIINNIIHNVQDSGNKADV